MDPIEDLQDFEIRRRFRRQNQDHSPSNRGQLAIGQDPFAAAHACLCQQFRDAADTTLFAIVYGGKRLLLGQPILYLLIKSKGGHRPQKGDQQQTTQLYEEPAIDQGLIVISYWCHIWC